MAQPPGPPPAPGPVPAPPAVAAPPQGAPEPYLGGRMVEFSDTQDPDVRAAVTSALDLSRNHTARFKQLQEEELEVESKGLGYIDSKGGKKVLVARTTYKTIPTISSKAGAVALAVVGSPAALIPAGRHLLKEKVGELWSGGTETVYHPLTDARDVARLKPKIKQRTSLPDLAGKPTYNVYSQDDVTKFSRERFESPLHRNEFTVISGHGMFWVDAQNARVVLIPEPQHGSYDFEHAISYKMKNPNTGKPVTDPESIRRAAYQLSIVSSEIDSAVSDAVNNKKDLLLRPDRMGSHLDRVFKTYIDLRGSTAGLQFLETKSQAIQQIIGEKTAAVAATDNADLKTLLGKEIQDLEQEHARLTQLHTSIEAERATLQGPDKVRFEGGHLAELNDLIAAAEAAPTPDQGKIKALKEDQELALQHLCRTLHGTAHIWETEPFRAPAAAAAGFTPTVVEESAESASALTQKLKILKEDLTTLGVDFTLGSSDGFQGHYEKLKKIMTTGEGSKLLGDEGKPISADTRQAFLNKLKAQFEIFETTTKEQNIQYQTRMQGAEQALQTGRLTGNERMIEEAKELIENANKERKQFQDRVHPMRHCLRRGIEAVEKEVQYLKEFEAVTTEIETLTAQLTQRPPAADSLEYATQRQKMETLQQRAGYYLDRLFTFSSRVPDNLMLQVDTSHMKTQATIREEFEAALKDYSPAQIVISPGSKEVRVMSRDVHWNEAKGVFEYNSDWHSAGLRVKLSDDCWRAIDDSFKKDIGDKLRAPVGPAGKENTEQPGHMTVPRGPRTPAGGMPGMP